MRWALSSAVSTYLTFIHNPVLQLAGKGPGATRFLGMGRTALDEDLNLVALAGHGLIRAALARDIGISDKVLRRLERDERILRLAGGVYVQRDLYFSSHIWRQFDLRSRAWTAAGRHDGHACDFSAAAILRLPMWGDPPDLPRLLRPGSAHQGHSRTPNGRIRYGWFPPHHQWEFSGSPVTSAAYTCIDVIRMGNRLQGLTIADYALAIGIPLEVLGRIAAELKLYKGIRAVPWVLGHADRRSESPLETAGRLVCLAFDLPTAIPNPWVLGGPSPRRVDLLLPDHGIILEADGALKYNNRPDASRVIADQGDRERELRELDFEVLRFDAALAAGRPGQLAARVRRAVARRRGRIAPTCWSVDPPVGWPAGPVLGAGWSIPAFSQAF